MRAQMTAASIPSPSAVLGYPIPGLAQLLPSTGLSLSPQIGAGLCLTEAEHAAHLPAWGKAFCSLSPAFTPRQRHGAQGSKPDPGGCWAAAAWSSAPRRVTVSSRGQDRAHVLHYITVSLSVFVAFSPPTGQSPHRQWGTSCFFGCVSLISRGLVAAANSAPRLPQLIAGH